MPTPTPFAAVPLRRFVDADQWLADDLAGRLSIVAHAAFLSAGFVPCGAVPRHGHLLLKHVDEIGPSSPSLSRRYKAPQLVARGEEGAAEVAVLEMRAQGDGDVAFQAYLLTTDGHRLCVCEALLDEADLAPILSGGVDDAARALETGAAGSWLWKPLADWVCRVLFLQLCQRNDLPVTGFVSLPDDAKAEILKRLPNGKDLAKVECCCRQLRRLVAERDGQLWKAMYLILELMPEEEASLDVPVPAFTWKERYVYASAAQQLPSNSSWFTEHELEILAQSVHRHLDTLHVPSLWELSFPLPMEDYFSFITEAIEEPMGFYMPPYLVRDAPPPAAAAPEVVARSRQFGGRQRKVPQKDHKKKRHGAGATHSPSSRYRWRHR